MNKRERKVGKKGKEKAEGKRQSYERKDGRQMLPAKEMLVQTGRKLRASREEERERERERGLKEKEGRFRH